MAAVYPRNLAPEKVGPGADLAVGDQPLQRHHYQRVPGAGRQQQVRAATKRHLMHRFPQERGRGRGLLQCHHQQRLDVACGARVVGRSHDEAAIRRPKRDEARSIKARDEEEDRIAAGGGRNSVRYLCQQGGSGGEVAKQQGRSWLISRAF